MNSESMKKKVEVAAFQEVLIEESNDIMEFRSIGNLDMAEFAVERLDYIRLVRKGKLNNIS